MLTEENGKEVYHWCLHRVVVLGVVWPLLADPLSLRVGCLFAVSQQAKVIGGYVDVMSLGRPEGGLYVGLSISDSWRLTGAKFGVPPSAQKSA